MFDNEDQMQSTVHEHPEIILSVIPEINPQFCPDAPELISLGRETPVTSGYIDNLFIDCNAILILVECKLYSNNSIKREVYSQAINYVSDIQNALTHFSGSRLQQELSTLLASARRPQYKSIKEIIERLKNEPLLARKKKKDWERDFQERLEYNIKNGICRIIILCAESSNNSFHQKSVRNLMRIMSFSEYSSRKYDLLLMDLREENNELLSRIIWRRYSHLPELPLTPHVTAENPDKNPDEKLDEKLRKLLELLGNNNLVARQNSFGYAIYRKNPYHSLYTQINIKGSDWSVVRNQIRQHEPIFDLLENDQPIPCLSHLSYKKRTRKSSLEYGQHLEVELPSSLDVVDLANAIIGLEAPIPDNSYFPLTENDKKGITKETSGKSTSQPETTENVDEKLQKLLELLEKSNLTAKKNTFGYAIYRKRPHHSIYTQITIKGSDWSVVRNQIRQHESIFDLLENNQPIPCLSHLDYQKRTRKSSLEYGQHLEVELPSTLDVVDLANAIIGLAAPIPEKQAKG